MSAQTIILKMMHVIPHIVLHSILKALKVDVQRKAITCLPTVQETLASLLSKETICW
jgi:hypothetical protein